MDAHFYCAAEFFLFVRIVDFMPRYLNELLFGCACMLLTTACGNGKLDHAVEIAGNPNALSSISIACPTGTKVRIPTQHGNSETGFTCSSTTSQQPIFSGVVNHRRAYVRFENTDSESMALKITCLPSEDASIKYNQKFTHGTIDVFCSSDREVGVRFDAPSVHRCSRLTDSPRNEQYITCGIH